MVKYTIYTPLGSTVEYSELNRDLKKRILEITEVYESTGLNGSATSSGFAENDENTIELTAISDTDSIDSTQLKLTIVTASTHNTNGNSYSQVKFQIKEIGGAYEDIKPYQKVNEDAGYDGINSYTITHTLTEGQKTNGFQVKVFTDIYIIVGSGTHSSHLSCINVIEEVM